MANDGITMEGADAEMVRIVEDVKTVGGAVVELVRDGGLWPSAAQWARARALTEAREWVDSITAGVLDEPEGPTSVEAQHKIEQLAERWAAWIESGELPA